MSFSFAITRKTSSMGIEAYPRASSSGKGALTKVHVISNISNKAMIWEEEIFIGGFPSL